MGGVLWVLQASAGLIQSVHKPPSHSVPCKPLTQKSSPEISVLLRKAEIREFVLQFPPAGFTDPPVSQGPSGGLGWWDKTGFVNR